MARVVIPLSTFGEFTIRISHLLGYSNKGQNLSAGIELKTCFLLYYKIKTYIEDYINGIEIVGVFSFGSIVSNLKIKKFSKSSI